MVTNATFESAGTTGWSGDGILTAATDEPHAGTGYLQVAPVLSCTPGDACDTGGQGDCSTSPLPAGCVYTADAATSTTATTTAGQAYHAAVWLKPAAQTTGQQATITVTEQSATGTVLGTASTQATLGPAGVWQAAGLDYTATGDGSTLTLTVSTPATSTTSAAFGLDDIALSKTS